MPGGYGSGHFKNSQDVEMKIRPDNFIRIVYFVLVLVGMSVLLVWFLHTASVRLAVEIPWWIETPSIVAILGLLYGWFDRDLWAWRGFRRLGLIDCPDLRGRWTGVTVSSHDGRERAIVLEVRQTASRIELSGYTEQSESVSKVASFETRSDGGVYVTYAYENRPRSGTPQTMECHEGTTTLTYFDDIRVLQGSYYTGRGRHTDGTIRVTYDRRSLLRRFD